ncbi:hypothetical protein PC9H_002605 [Pleurotus ostreatus]|uniref:Uncharacterized protein n=1 Tax=Pleurotus ostreatus TaxID=5322 RepID=A0A8H7DNG6_PLEOS|nr:uncharacterized protein PC9H_002605 [Pleurotus ostreatus]KAF7416340.1 hypothetical protein PC9H_002605 [Pleurotus ostreatus]KAJ8689229.1 hypothetical protein PTI98_013272 [Pleurotus ostreatus]
MGNAQDNALTNCYHHQQTNHWGTEPYTTRGQAASRHAKQKVRVTTSYKTQPKQTPQEKPHDNHDHNSRKTKSMTNTTEATNMSGLAGPGPLDPHAAAKATKRKRPNGLEREDGELDDEGRAHDEGTQGDARPPNPTGGTPAQANPQLLSGGSLDNPHAQSSQRGLPPLEPTQSRIAYTKAVYPRVIKSLDSLLAEIMEATAEAVKANPGKYMALLIYGGGNKVKEENPELTNDIETFLQGLTIAGSERLRVVDPPKRDTDKRGEFAKPHILLLQHGSPELRAYLLWHQTFAFQIEGRKIAFSALRFDANVRPWFITDIVGRAICDDPNAIREGLATITHALAKDTDFRNHVDVCLAKVENPRSIDERVRDTLQSFEIHAMRVTNKEKKDITVWQLYANPIANNGLEYKEWLKIITSRHYIIDEIDEMFVRYKNLKPYDSCAFCKSEAHPEEQCPFPLVADWKGPIPKDVRAERAKLKEEAAAARGSNRDWGNGRESRGSRPARGSSSNMSRARPY